MAKQQSKKRMGRPPKEGGVDPARSFRVADTSWQLWQEAAKLSGQSQSSWMRAVLDKAARRILKSQ
jgi:hypothetical protein